MTANHTTSQLKELSASIFEFDMIMSGNQIMSDFAITGDIVLQKSPLNPGDYTITNCLIGSLDLSGATFESLTLDNCMIKMLMIGSSAIKNLNVSRCRITHFEITPVAKNVQRYKIQKNISIENLVFQQGSEMNEITISDNNEIHDLTIKLLGTPIIDISGQKPDDEHRINYVKVESAGTININSITIAKNLDVRSSSGGLELDRVHADVVNLLAGHIKAVDCKISTLHIPQAGHIAILGGSISNIVGHKELGSISINSSTTSVCEINYLHLQEVKFANPMIISNCVIKKMNLKRAAKPFGNAPLTFRLAQIKDELDVENADMNGTTLDSVDLSTATVRYLNSTWDDSKLLNVQWPSEFYEYASERKKQPKFAKLNTLWALKAGYRKFKVLSLAQNNKIDAMKFQKHELKSYWRIVHIKTWRESFKDNIGIWLILGSNRLFSDFGQNIFLPLSWLFGTHSLLYYFLLSCHDLGVAPGFTANFDWTATRSGIAMFFNLINPVHATKIESQFLPIPVSIFGVTDFFMRIFSGYFIYYFLQATRKFNFSV